MYYDTCLLWDTTLLVFQNNACNVYNKYVTPSKYISKTETKQNRGPTDCIYFWLLKGGGHCRKVTVSGGLTAGNVLNSAVMNGPIMGGFFRRNCCCCVRNSNLTYSVPVHVCGLWMASCPDMHIHKIRTLDIFLLSQLPVTEICS